ncbi:glycosyltransferase family 2 protein [Empedobacter falsenii]
MDKTPLISVVIPVYNAEKYLSDCIESLLSQEFKDFEVVLVNDGSKDESSSIALNYCAKHPFIKYFEQQNAGAARARFFGVQKAKAEYITFVDADDTLTSDALQILSQELIKSNYQASIVIANSKDAEYSGEELQRKILVEETICGPCSKLFKKTLLNEFAFSVPKEIKVGEDLLMNLRIIQHHKEVLVREVNQTIYHYNRNEGSLTASLVKTMPYEALFYQELLQSLSTDDQKRLMKELIQSRIRGIEHVYLCNNGSIDKESNHYQNLMKDIKNYKYSLNFEAYVLLKASAFFKPVFYARLLKNKLIN